MSTVTAPPQPQAAAASSVDWGRTLMVPVSVLLGAAALVRIVTLLLGDGRSAPALALALLPALLTAGFYVLIVRAYLRRGAAHATSRTPSALVAAPVATFLPFALPVVGSGLSSAVVLAVGELLLVIGFAFSVWALRCLDRSLSVVPQARALVQHGPYATVRHPLYLGELVAMLGLALTLGGPGPLLLWALLALLQAHRAVHEERLLTEVLPEYAEYRTRTARIVPGLF